MSRSRAMQVRFLERDRRRKAVAAVYVVATLAYLAWRSTIFSEVSPIASSAYFAAEAIGFVLALTVIATSWRYRHRVPPPATAGLSVDVLVTTFKEPVELVRRTLTAARDIAYPHRTWLLDDGNRSEMAALAAELGVEYLARARNEFAKAGNLNHGLANSSADFVAVFDADHIPQRHALDVMLGFFADPSVALVQTPQDFYNADAFQYMNSARTGALWHDQSFFYNIAQPCRDAMDGASCVGTSAVYRRSALDAIGGFPVETVTEDVHTSLKLHKLGLEVVYLNEPVAYGIAAADLSDYYRTRHRWAHGNIHALRIENTLFTGRLTWAQKLAYLTLGLIYLEGWQQMLLFAVPIGALLFGLPPFEISIFNVLIVLVFPMVSFALLQEFGCGFSRYWANEIFAMARFPVHIVASAALWRGRMLWRTSTKNIKGRVRLGLLSPQIAVCALSLFAVLAGLWRLWNDWQIGPLARFVMALVPGLGGGEGPIDWFAPMTEGYPVDLVAVAGFWALFNAARAGFLIRKAARDAATSAEEPRFAVPLPVEIVAAGRRAAAVTTRVSVAEVEIRLYQPLGAVAPGQRLDCRIHLPAGSVEARIEPASGDEGRLAARLVWARRAEKDRLAAALYSIDWHREFTSRQGEFLTPIQALVDLARLRWPRAPGRETWCGALVEAGDRGAAQAYAVVRKEPAGGSLIAFRPFAEGEAVRARVFEPSGVAARTFLVAAAEPMQCLDTLGLDGARARRYAVTEIEAPAQPVAAPDRLARVGERAGADST